MPNRSATLRILIVGVASIVLALAVFAAIRWRQRPANLNDLYAALPFQPRVTYEGSKIIITNTEGQPYLDTSLNVYIGGTLYRAQLGTIHPGVTTEIPLRSLTNDRGESFDSTRTGISELEVRARFGGYDVHKDFPPPRQ